MIMIDHVMVWFEMFEYQRTTMMRLRTAMMRTYIKNLPMLASSLKTHGLEYICVHAKSYLTNGSFFKQDLIPLIKDFDIKPVLKTVKNHNIMLRWSG